MIPLVRPDAPSELTAELVSRLTDEFIKNQDKAVWRLSFLKDALLNMSHHKCAYCESDLQAQGNYMEVEHIRYKHQYKHEVLLWDNLLPACKGCNSSKSDHDVIKEPIVDPTKTHPAIHLYLRDYRVWGRDTIGKTTVIVLNLNNTRRLMLKRAEIGNKIHETLEKLVSDLERLLLKPTSSKTRRQVVNGLKALLEEAQPNSPFSATAATALMTNKSYGDMKRELSSMGCWDDELEQLDNGARFIALIEKID